MGIHIFYEANPQSTGVQFPRAVPKYIFAVRGRGLPLSLGYYRCYSCLKANTFYLYGWVARCYYRLHIFLFWVPWNSLGTRIFVPMDKECISQIIN